MKVLLFVALYIVVNEGSPIILKSEENFKDLGNLPPGNAFELTETSSTNSENHDAAKKDIGLLETKFFGPWHRPQFPWNPYYQPYYPPYYPPHQVYPPFKFPSHPLPPPPPTRRPARRTTTSTFSPMLTTTFDDLTESPEPVDLTESPEPVDLTESPEPVDLTESPEPVELTESPEPVDLTESPETVDLTESPEPVDLTESPETVDLTESPDSIQSTESVESMMLVVSVPPVDVTVTNHPLLTFPLGEAIEQFINNIGNVFNHIPIPLITLTKNP